MNDMSISDRDFAFDEMTALPPAFVLVMERFGGVHFTPQEARVLAYLLSRHGRICGRSHIYAASRVTDNDCMDEKIVDVTVCKLRMKLKRINPDWKILTAWGVGYSADGFPNEMRHYAASDAPESVLQFCDSLLQRHILPALARSAPSHREAVKSYLTSAIAREV